MTLVPLPDSIGIAAPANILQQLYFLTLTINNVFAYLVIGIPLMITAHEIITSDNPFFRSISKNLIKGFRLAVIMYIATYFIPRLLAETLYGNFVYTTNILLEWTLVIIPLLILVALVVSEKIRLEYEHYNRCAKRKLFLLLALKLLAVSIFVSSSTLLSTPRIWSDFASGKLLSLLWNLSFISNLITTLTISTAIMGAVISLMGKWESDRERAVKYGFRLVVFSSLAGIVFAILHIISLGFSVHQKIISYPAAPITAIFLILTLIGIAILGIMRPRNQIWPVLACAFIPPILFFNIQTMNVVKTGALKFDPVELPVKTQPTMMVLFFIVTAISISIIFKIAHQIFGKNWQKNYQ